MTQENIERYYEIREALNDQQKLVLNCFQNNPDTKFQRQELLFILQCNELLETGRLNVWKTINNVSPRITELKQQGHLIETESVTKTIKNPLGFELQHTAHEYQFIGIELFIRMQENEQMELIF